MRISIFEGDEGSDLVQTVLKDGKHITVFLDGVVVQDWVMAKEGLHDDRAATFGDRGILGRLRRMPSGSVWLDEQGFSRVQKVCGEVEIAVS